MNKDFDLDKFKKQTPYKVQDGFFDELENNVAAELGINTMHKETAKIVDFSRKYTLRLKIACISTFVAAVCIAVSFILHPKELSTVDMQSIEQAYTNLSQTDQDFLIEVYQDDLFLREQ